MKRDTRWDERVHTLVQLLAMNHSLASISDEGECFLRRTSPHILFLTLPTKFRYFLFSAKENDDVDEMGERERRIKSVYNMLIIILSLLSVASTISRCCCCVYVNVLRGERE